MNYTYFVLCCLIAFIGALIGEMIIVMLGMLLAGGFMGRAVECIARGDR